MATDQSYFRLNAEDKARIEAIRQHFAFDSEAAAVRYALRFAAQYLPVLSVPPPSAVPRKKSRKSTAAS